MKNRMWVCLDISAKSGLGPLCNWVESEADRTWRGFATKKEAQEYADREGGTTIVVACILLDDE